jgi:hypothetical protein
MTVRLQLIPVSRLPYSSGIPAGSQNYGQDTKNPVKGLVKEELHGINNSCTKIVIQSMFNMR